MGEEVEAAEDEARASPSLEDPPLLQPLSRCPPAGLEPVPRGIVSSLLGYGGIVYEWIE